MDNQDVNALIQAFKGYRDLLAPVQDSLATFAESYLGLRDNLESVKQAFAGDIEGKLDKIYQNLSAQAAKANDLSAHVDQFARAADRYVQEVGRLAGLVEKIEGRLSAVSEIEARAEAQIGRLDAILEEKKRSYNLKELERALEGYNQNVQRVSEFINKDVAEKLSSGEKRLAAMQQTVEGFAKSQDAAGGKLERLIDDYAATTAFLKKATEKGDVNEAYLFEILDRWADDRRVKIKR
jgi:DNA-binding transcriptional MerR regulator